MRVGSSTKGASEGQPEISVPIATQSNADGTQRDVPLAVPCTPPAPATPVTPPAGAAAGRKVDPVLQLAFDSAKQKLTQQDATLAALRNRATGLLAASSVGTSVAAAVGLLNLDPTRGRVYPIWAGWTMVALVLAVGICVVIVIWPAQKWSFGVEPGRILKDLGSPVDEVYQKVTKALTQVASSNAASVKLRQRVFEAGAALLIMQTAMIALSLGLGGRGA